MMNFHLNSLLDLPAVNVKNCTPLKIKILFHLSIRVLEIVRHYCDNYPEYLDTNRPILAIKLSVLGGYVYLQVPKNR